MGEILAVLLFSRLGWKALGLSFRLTWGAGKIAAALLMGLALPFLIGCLLFAGGLLLLLPLGIVRRRTAPAAASGHDCHCLWPAESLHITQRPLKPDGSKGRGPGAGAAPAANQAGRSCLLREGINLTFGTKSPPQGISPGWTFLCQQV